MNIKLNKFIQKNHPDLHENILELEESIQELFFDAELTQSQTEKQTIYQKIYAQQSELNSLLADAKKFYQAKKTSPIIP